MPKWGLFICVCMMTLGIGLAHGVRRRHSQRGSNYRQNIHGTNRRYDFNQHNTHNHRQSRYQSQRQYYSSRRYYYYYYKKTTTTEIYKEDAKWSEWGEWSGGCSFFGKTCGDDGFQIRFRECIEGCNGDITCNNLEGPDHELRNCSLCCPVNAVWQPWSEYSDCVPDIPGVTCGVNGTRTRTRTCVEGSCGGDSCYRQEDDCENMAQQTMQCSLGCCPGECIGNSLCIEDGSLLDCGDYICQGGDCLCPGYIEEGGVSQCDGEVSCRITSYNEDTYTFTDEEVTNAKGGQLITTFHDVTTLLDGIDSSVFILIATSTTADCPPFSIRSVVRPDSDKIKRNIKITSHGVDITVSDGSNVPMTHASFELTQEDDYVIFRNNCGVKASFGRNLTSPEIIINIVMPSDMLDNRVDGACGDLSWEEGKLVDRFTLSYESDVHAQVQAWLGSYYE